MHRMVRRRWLAWAIVAGLVLPLAAAQPEADSVRGIELTAAADVPDKDVKVEAQLFVPEKVRGVRAVTVVIRYGLGGSAIYRDPKWRRLSESTETGLMHFRISSLSTGSTAQVWNDAGLGGGDGLVLILQRLAKESGRPEIATVPLLFWGHSSGGPFGTTFAGTHAERTIGFVRYHSGGVTTNLNAVKGIPALFLMGGKDTNFPKAAAAAATLWNNGRQQGAPWTWAVEPDATHGDLADVLKANDLAIPWAAAVIRQRLSPSGDALRPISVESSWLGNNRTGEVAPYGSFSGVKEAASWLPDEATARAWQAVIGAGRK